MDFFSEIFKGIENRANLDLNAFREPRGACRILQLVIGLLAGITIYGYEGIVTVYYTCLTPQSIEIPYSYPFQLVQTQGSILCNGVTTQFLIALNDSFSQYAEYFMWICSLSIIFCFISMFLYCKMAATYETDNRYPLADFVVTVIIAVLWLFASATWTHGLSGLKANTDPDIILSQLKPKETTSLQFNKVTHSNYFRLNASALLGSLCFFVWAADLWFLYKETPWFRGRQQAVSSPA